MWSSMELVHPLEPTGEESPLARARLHRQLTVEETARRAGITAEEVRWLEEGRVYRFPRPDDALMATALYATALGLDNREARELAGLPVPAQAVARNPLPRLLVGIGVVIAVAIFAALLLIPRSGGSRPQAGSSAVLPPPWRIPVNVLNGSGDINYTRQVASRVGAFGYSIKKVARADNFTYPQTAVYFPPKCESVAFSLARKLGVPTKPLPGGSGPCQLYVIVGPARGPGE
ncbi:MAG: LytR cell envelope-related transcriptional attenuator [Gaiellaceae bacterium]|jgi:transcriptional regulator with XRE-family HTH domain|nr:LytR cell envelope-related transcriptional attenuator [Gaiellaceae bacterium]